MTLRAAFMLILLVLMSRLMPSTAQGTDVRVRNDQQLYQAFKYQSVGSIGIAYGGASLAPYAADLNNYVASRGPFQVQRSLTLYGALSGARPTLDFAYLGGIVALASGTTFTLRGLSLYRLQALRAPVGLFATSPGATVVVQDSVNNQQVCWPHEGAQAYFLQIFPRPFPESQSATICSPGTEGSCNTYTFADIGFSVSPSPEFGTGGYAMHYLNTIINCQSYASPVPTCNALQNDIATGSYSCLATVYDPANFRTVCPTCQCINGCRQACNNAGLAGPGGC